MIPSLTSTTFAMLVFGVFAFIFIMLLPALLELKKPRDAGPRKILENTIVPLTQTQIIMLEKGEEKIVLDQPVMKKLVDVISILPNLEG